MLAQHPQWVREKTLEPMDSCNVAEGAPLPAMRAPSERDYPGCFIDQPSANSPSKPAKSISASRVWKPRFNAAWNRLWASAACAASPNRSESRRKSARGASVMALTRSLTETRPAERPFTRWVPWKIGIGYDEGQLGSGK